MYLEIYIFITVATNVVFFYDLVNLIVHCREASRMGLRMEGFWASRCGMAGEAKARNLVLVVGAARDFPLRSVSYVRWGYFTQLHGLLYLVPCCGSPLVSYLLLVSLSQVLHVEGLRIRPGIIVVSRYLVFLSWFFAVCGLPPIIFHICSIVISSHCLVHHCSLFCSLPFAAIRHCFSSLLFVTAFRHCFSSLPICTLIQHFRSVRIGIRIRIRIQGFDD